MAMVLRSVVVILAVLLLNSSQAGAGYCSLDHRYSAEYRNVICAPARDQEDDTAWWITPILMAISFLLGILTRFSNKPPPGDVERAVGRAFTKRETEADVHGSLSDLNRPLRAAYDGVKDELKKLGVWP
jgi:hypothetical protein